MLMLTLILNLTLLNPSICAHIDTQNNFFFGIYKAGFMGGAENCTTCENPTLADLAVLSIGYQRQ